MASKARLLQVALAVVAAWLGALPVEAIDFELRGSIRGRYGTFSSLAGENEQLELRARPEMLFFLSDRLSANLTLRGQRGWGLAEAALGDGDLHIDRAYLDIELGRWDVRVGRQAINFGQALIWNPVDLVDSNAVLDFDIVKEGIDTVRASYSLSSTASLLGLVAFAEGGSLAVLRGEALLGGTDAGMLVASDRRQDEIVVGVDLKGDLTVGWWLEGAYHDRPGSIRGGGDFYRLVLGLDYSFPVLDQLYLAVQYYRDSSGGTGVADYDFAAALAEGRRFLARQYGSLIATLAVDELSSASASVIYNLEDQSYVLTGGFSRFFFENLDVTLRASLFRGSGPGEFNPAAGGPFEGRQPSEAYELYLEWSF